MGCDTHCDFLFYIQVNFITMPSIIFKMITAIIPRRISRKYESISLRCDFCDM